MWILQYQEIIRKIHSEKSGVSLSVLVIFIKEVNANAHIDVVKVQTNIHNLVFVSRTSDFH